MNPKISIFLPAFRSKDLLYNVFFKGLCRNTKENVELILYDNTGNGEDIEKILIDGAKELVPKNITVKLRLSNNENVGLNKAFNDCAKVAEGEYFYLCHTDMYVLPGWDTALLSACLNLAPISFLLCSRSIEPGYSHVKSQIRKDYGNELNNFQEEKLLKEYKQFVENKIVVNARMPFFMHRKLWERLGGVDEKYHSFCSDDDIIQDCYYHNVRRFYMIYDSLIYHLQGKSNSQQTIDKDKDWPYRYFVEKWKAKYPDICHPGQYHPGLIPFELRVK
ncbi:glycosyltransferase [Candidatus Pacearchaeota archaeon]|nr:glycosyltransferase [Candidatus Pacearchaeota archaeon]